VSEWEQSEDLVCTKGDMVIGVVLDDERRLFGYVVVDVLDLVQRRGHIWHGRRGGGMDRSRGRRGGGC